MGRLTPTNCPLCSAGPVEGTNWPSSIPIAMLRMIQRTRKRSRKERPFNGGISFAAASCSSVSRQIDVLIIRISIKTYQAESCLRGQLRRTFGVCVLLHLDGAQIL